MEVSGAKLDEVDLEVRTTVRKTRNVSVSGAWCANNFYCETACTFK